MDAAIEDAKASYLRWGLISNLADPSLRTVRKASFPKSLSSSISIAVSLVPEFIWPISELSMLSVVLWCVWSTFVETALNKTVAYNSEHFPVPKSVPEPVLVCRSVPEPVRVYESIPVNESVHSVLTPVYENFLLNTALCLR